MYISAPLRLRRAGAHRDGWEESGLILASAMVELYFIVSRPTNKGVEQGVN